MDLIENFTLYDEARGGLVKITGKNHQFLGVNNAGSPSPEATKRYLTGRCSLNTRYVSAICEVIGLELKPSKSRTKGT